MARRWHVTSAHERFRALTCQRVRMARGSQNAQECARALSNALRLLRRVFWFWRLVLCRLSYSPDRQRPQPPVAVHKISTTTAASRDRPEQSLDPLPEPPRRPVPPFLPVPQHLLARAEEARQLALAQAPCLPGPAQALAERGARLPRAVAENSMIRAICRANGPFWFCSRGAARDGVHVDPEDPGHVALEETQPSTVSSRGP